jgi:hypothetical protein
MSANVIRLPLTRRAVCFWAGRWEAQDMTSLPEAESKFGDVVRSAGGAIFAIEKGPSFYSRQEEKLQIGTPDGFVKLAVALNQPDIDAVLREKTTNLVRHAEELRQSSCLIVASSLMPRTPTGRLRVGP